MTYLHFLMLSSQVNYNAQHLVNRHRCSPADFALSSISSRMRLKKKAKKTKPHGVIGSFDKIVVLNKNRAGSRVYQTKINTTCHAVTRWQVSCNLKQQLTRSLARVRVCLSTVQWKINEHRNPPHRLTEWIDKKVANNYRHAARRWHAIFWLQCRT